MDLTVPQWIGRKFDYVMSLEVGEHISQESESVFINNIARHAKCGLVVSWAVKGQAGHHHINTQDNEYIIDQFSKIGFKFNENQTKQLRDSVISFPYFQNTLMAFGLPGNKC